jgi:hypothetical protein
MLNKQPTPLIALTILLAFANPPKPLSATLAAQLSSAPVSLSVTNETENVSQKQALQENKAEFILADATNNNAASEPKSKSNWLWWLIPLIILVPFLGWLVLNRRSQFKQQSTDINDHIPLEHAGIASFSAATSVEQENITEIYSHSDNKVNSRSSNLVQEAPQSKSNDPVDNVSAVEELFGTVESSTDNLSDLTANLVEESKYLTTDVEPTISQQPTNLIVEGEQTFSEEATVKENANFLERESPPETNPTNDWLETVSSPRDNPSDRSANVEATISEQPTNLIVEGEQTFSEEATVKENANFLERESPPETNPTNDWLETIPSPRDNLTSENSNWNSTVSQPTRNSNDEIKNNTSSLDDLFDLIDNPSNLSADFIDSLGDQTIDFTEEEINNTSNFLEDFAPEKDDTSTQLSESNFQFLDDLLESNSDIKDEKKN